jgi:hypothetical protein
MKNSIKFILAAGFLFALFSSCSNDDIKLPGGLNPSSSSSGVGKPTTVKCLVDGKCNIISEELCSEIEGKALPEGQTCGSGNYPVVPEFTCEWVPDTVALTGDSSMLKITLLSEDPNCKPKAIYKRDFTAFNYVNKKKSIVGQDSSLDILGYLECKKVSGDTLYENVPPEYQDCKPLVIKPDPPVPSPIKTGEFAINSFLYVEDSDSSYYYSIDTIPSITDSSFIITNADSAKCTDNVKYELFINESKTMRRVVAGDIVKAVATVVCNEEDVVLATLTAATVPNPVLSNCVWNRTDVVKYDSISTSRRSVPIMHEDQTLKVSAKLDYSYGRCEVQYSFNGATTPSADSTLSLKTFTTWGQSSAGNRLSAKAVASCPRNTIPDKVCAGVDSIYVAYHVNKKGGCAGGDGNKFPIKVGITIFEFACEEPKSANKDDPGAGYYISCDGAYDRTPNFTVAAEGGTVPGDGHNGWNFVGQIVSEDPDPVDGLYHYPVPALIRTSVTGGQLCSIW